MRAILLSFLLIFAQVPAASASVDRLLAALDEADTLAVAEFVEAHYRDAGISTNQTLVWETQDFDEIVNWYNQWSETIMLSRLPTRAETPAYWDNWSRVLTASRWRWQDFFSDPEEAYRLAGFNQFLLAAHEYGHALTYRFDPEHEARGDNAINCREYPADRLAATLLQELSDTDPRIAALQQRYRALIEAIQAEIDPAIRLTLPSFAALDADCRMLHVEQPQDEAGMVQYASAFFARHALLLATDLPPLADLYASHLLPRWRERQRPDSGLAGAVTTGPLLPETPELEAGLNRSFALGADGEVYVLDSHLDGWPLQLRLRFGPLGGPLEDIVPMQRLALGTVPETSLIIAGALALGPDHVLAVTSAYADEQVWLISLRRDGTVWWPSFRQVARGISYSPALAFDATGGVHLFIKEQSAADEYETELRHLRIEPEPVLAITDLGLEPDPGPMPSAIHALGVYLMSDSSAVLVPTEDDQLFGFAGGLQGFKDNASPLEAEFAAYTLQLLPAADGSVRVLDYDPESRRMVIRHIAPAPGTSQP